MLIKVKRNILKNKMMERIIIMIIVNIVNDTIIVVGK